MRKSPLPRYLSTNVGPPWGARTSHDPALAPFELLMALDLTNGVKVTFECLKPESLIVKILNNKLEVKKQKWDIINLFCQEIFHEFKHSVMDEIDTNSRQTDSAATA